MRLLLVASVLFAGVGSLAAQSVTEYYVVRNPDTKRCTIVSERPTSTTMVVVGDRAYKTRTDAEASVKTTKICTDD